MQLPTTETPIQLRFTDIDLLGHVSNSIYLSYFDLGRVEFFKDVKSQFNDDDFYYTVVVKIELEYMKEVGLTDELTVKTTCQSIGTKSMQLEQVALVEGNVTTKALVTLVCIDPKEKKSKPFPKDWEPS